MCVQHDNAITNCKFVSEIYFLAAGTLFINYFAAF